MSVPAKEKRIDIRVSQPQKELLEKAADLKGMSLSSYLLSRGLEAAREDIESHQRLILSDRDRDLFLDLLANPPAPNRALQKAMQQYREEYESGEMDY
ncbi:DUF1778 domain-containing protein [Pannus brasiliensis CCIBt3594]|uniref:DUF1778 domain-containing protein n=1 Tax=Pannus brasiliensis CCIBt3594 TaxID=1427578 RepID=A0AAW9QZJ6_9CHRO